MVEQSGPDSNKVLLDQVADVEATFDEVVTPSRCHALSVVRWVCT